MQKTGQTLRALKFIIYISIFVRSVPKTQSAHEWDLALVSGPDFWCNLHYFSSRGRSRSSRSPRGAPEGRTSAKNPGPDLSFILPKVCPAVSANNTKTRWASQPPDIPLFAGRHPGRRTRPPAAGSRPLAPPVGACRSLAGQPASPHRRPPHRSTHRNSTGRS